MTPRRATALMTLTFALVVVLSMVLSALAAETTPEAILKNPATFDGAVVVLRGSVTNLKATVSRKGNAYYTFDLAAQGRSVKIFSFGTPPCPDGASVIVDGRFSREKRVSGRTFYNEVEAAKVVCR